MPTVTNFEDLDAWIIARELTSEVYRITGLEPFCRNFELKNQMRRAGISVMSNIAEGFERDGTREYINFLSIAKGSCGEIRAQLFVALDQNYIDRPTFEALYQKAERNGRIIGGLMKYLKHSGMAGHKFDGMEHARRATRNT